MYRGVPQWRLSGAIRNVQQNSLIRALFVHRGAWIINRWISFVFLQQLMLFGLVKWEPRLAILQMRSTRSLPIYFNVDRQMCFSYHFDQEHFAYRVQSQRQAIWQMLENIVRSRSTGKLASVSLALIHTQYYTSTECDRSDDHQAASYQRNKKIDNYPFWAGEVKSSHCTLSGLARDTQAIHHKAGEDVGSFLKTKPDEI